jgi:putative nucleotidyltransferase with HDIG domain
MSEPVKFLNAFAQALATMGLYDPGHPARARVGDAAYVQLRELQEHDTRPHFSFLDESVVYGQRALHEMRQWPWAARLADAGVQRIEFAADLNRHDFDAFLNDMLVLLKLPGADQSQLRAEGRSGVRYGTIGVRDQDEEALAEPVEETQAAACDLVEELEVARWLYHAAQHDNTVPMAEAETLVRSLALAMHADGTTLLPLLGLKSHDQYTAMHSVNVAVLVMAFAEHLGLRRADIHAFGVAGLLHDIGMSRVPPDLLDRYALTRDEQALLEQHPMEGARLLLNGDPDSDVAAVVAYEHHLRADGGGYPALRFPRSLHYASRVVQLCAVYDALRNSRPFRPAWPAAQALSHIERNAGSEFDADLAGSFVGLMRQVHAESRVITVRGEALINV